MMAFLNDIMLVNKWIRTCQKCGYKQIAKSPTEYKNDSWQELKCKKCKSQGSMDYGSIYHNEEMNIMEKHFRFDDSVKLYTLDNLELYGYISTDDKTILDTINIGESYNFSDGEKIKRVD